MLLAACGFAQAPLWPVLGAPNVNVATQAWQGQLQNDTVYVFDKGYCDYNWWAKIDAIGSRFVTRFKSNAGIEPVEDLLVQSRRCF